jgi:hypothetical protein
MPSVPSGTGAGSPPTATSELPIGLPEPSRKVTLTHEPAGRPSGCSGSEMVPAASSILKVTETVEPPT